jgi:hypothetical protein
MDVIEYTPTRGQYAYTFGGVASAMRVRPGTALRLWSEDAFNGALRSVDDLSSAKVDLRFVNPQTGPFYVEGAEPGDTLVLHLVALEPARDWGASAAIPFFGGMTSTDRVVTLQEPLPRHGFDSTVTRHSRFARGATTDRLPIEPMLGFRWRRPCWGRGAFVLGPTVRATWIRGCGPARPSSRRQRRGACLDRHGTTGRARARPAAGRRAR